MSRKHALIIGNTEYTDPGLAQLTAPGKDAEDFAQVLKSPDFGGFDEVTTIINQDASIAKEAIEEFFNEKTKDDLLVLYFSGHGVKDEVGNLYLAVKNTRRTKLRSTGIESGFVRVAMDQSRSKRQVLILDCCNSGAFAQGTKAETGGSIGTASAFNAGSGQIILTASDSTQFAWEGDKVIGETTNSLFTHFLVKGIKGEADRNGDGQITVDELYDYAYEQVRLATPKQTPSKFSNKQQGEIILRQGMRIEDIKPMPLPSELLEDIENPRTVVRGEAVQQLIKLLNGKNLGLARSAREALERIAQNDDSRTISQTAFQALEALRQADEVAKQKEDEAQKKREEDEAKRAELQKAEAQRLLNERAIEAERQEKEKAERFAAQKVEEERIAKAQAEAEHKAKEEANRLAAQKAEEERVAKAKAKADRKAKEETEHIAAQKAEEERITKAKAETERKAKDEAGNEAMELAARRKAEREEKEKIVVVSKATKTPWRTFGIIGGAIVVLCLCGYAATSILPSLLGGAVPVVTSQSRTLKIISSLPMTGASLTQTQTIVNAEQLRLEQAKNQACGGKYTLAYEAWDDASAALGKWDPAVETENANKAAADSSIIAYLGTFNSGAAKLSIPILNAAGPLTMISPANTNPGLTKADKNLPGVTASYYPSGVRNYARVVAADDIQGKVAANFVKSLNATTVYILDDQELYGKGVADTFEATAKEIGLTVVGHEGIDPKAADYKALITKISTSNGGKAPDVVYFGGLVDSGGPQLLKDKVAIMGDNTKVKFVGPDGIQTQAFIDGAGADISEGVYASVAGLPIEKQPAAAQQFKKDYDAKYGGDLNEPYAVYGYETMNVLLKAIEDVCAAGGNPTDRATVNKAVHSIKDFNGVLGTWSFDANGDTTLTDMTFYVVKSGKFEPIGSFK